MYHVVIPAGLHLAELARYPLRLQTANILRREGLFEGHSGLSVGKLLLLRNFGIVSLLEFMCVAELALTGRFPQVAPSKSGPIEWEETAQKSSAWSDVIDVFELLLAAAREFRGARTVGEALRLDLSYLIATIGIAPVLESLSIQDLTDRSIANTVCERLTSLLASLSSTQRLILERRLIVASPVTLQELAEQIGITRERVRQIAVEVLGIVEETVGEEASIVAALISKQLDPIIPEADFELLITEVFNDDMQRQSAVELGRRIIKSRLNYSCVDGMCFNEAAGQVIVKLQDLARGAADDVGLIDEDSLRHDFLDGEWDLFIPQLIERCGFHRIGGRLALRDTGKARVKVALLKIGRPATKEEIAEFSNFDAVKVGSHLSVIPSLVRVDKIRWGLTDWTDDVYEGIPAEIIQRINEDGGSTPLSRLCEELPELFGVREASVRAYASSPQFILRDGYVSLADESSITLRNLDDVIEGRDSYGNPFWTFLVDNRYFDGYSLLWFPPELARELGCKPNGKTLALVNKPEGSCKVSVVWRLASLSGASVGHLADPLRRIGARDGDRVRMVIRGPGIVDILRESTATSKNVRSGSTAESLLKRMKNRRRLI